jgi:hypothetical protein
MLCLSLNLFFVELNIPADWPPKFRQWKVLSYSGIRRGEERHVRVGFPERLSKFNSTRYFPFDSGFCDILAVIFFLAILPVQSSRHSRTSRGGYAVVTADIRSRWKINMTLST